MRRVVVLPQPLGPSSATMLPGSMLSETRSTAREAPKILVSSARRSAAGAGRTRSGSEDFVVLLDELRAHGIDERPVGAEDTHLAHLCFRIGHVFFDVGLEAEPAERGGGKGLLGEQLLDVGAQHPIDKGDRQFALRTVLEERHGVYPAKCALVRV